jgi:hypothetical protein
MRTSLTSGHSCQAPRYAARFSKDGTRYALCEPDMNSDVLEDISDRRSEAIASLPSPGTESLDSQCNSWRPYDPDDGCVRLGAPSRSTVPSRSAVNCQTVPVLPWPVEPSLTNLSDNADQVHATVGFRPVAASSAGGRIPRIAWTSKHDVDSSIGLRSRKPYSQGQEIGRRRMSIDACCRPLTSPISSLGRSCWCS